MTTLGYKHTPEAKAKIGAASRKRRMSPEGRAKVAAAQHNRKHGPLSAEHRAKIGAAEHGENNARWKGGRYSRRDGYILSFCPDHPHANARGYVMEHRLVMEAHIGRILNPNETVHHINGDVADNRIENLMRFDSNADHLRWHAKQGWSKKTP